jgi:hypothetical protein
MFESVRAWHFVNERWSTIVAKPASLQLPVEVIDH